MPNRKKLSKKQKENIEELIKKDMKISKISREKDFYKIKYKNSLAEIDKLRKILDLRKYLTIDKKSNNNKIVKKYKSSTSESTAVVVASDWHVEETVSAETVNNLNEYNLKIAKKRITKFFQKIIIQVELYRNITKIDNLILALLGDFITGYIHEENLENNKLTPLEAVRFVQKNLIAGIEYLLKHGNFKNIIIPCSYGNHGRTTQKYKISKAAENSFEQHMYLSLAEYFKKNKKIKFIINSSYHTYIDVYDFKLRFHHGDHIKYRGGIGGPTIPINKAIAQWNKSQPVYLDVFGHLHTMIDGGQFIVNGSLIGYNPFALSIKASYEEPKQVFFLIEKSRGKTSVSPIFLSDSK